MAGQECQFTVSFDPRDESERQLVREFFERFESNGGFGASDSLTDTPKGGLFFRTWSVDGLYQVEVDERAMRFMDDFESEFPDSTWRMEFRIDYTGGDRHRPYVVKRLSSKAAAEDRRKEEEYQRGRRASREARKAMKVSAQRANERSNSAQAVSDAGEAKAKADWGFRRAPANAKVKGMDKPGLVFYKGADEVAVVPDMIGKRVVTGLGDEAFATYGDDGEPMGYGKNRSARMEVLREVICPDSIIYIGWFAFCGSGVRRLEIPGTVKKVDEHAFFMSGIKEIAVRGTKRQYERTKKMLEPLVQGAAVVRVE